DGGILDDGLDHQVGGNEVGGGFDPGEDGAGLGAALLVELRQAPLDRGQAALDGPARAFVQADPPPRGGGDLGDPAAHLPRANHEHVIEPHGRRLAASATTGTRYRYEFVTKC